MSDKSPKEIFYDKVKPLIESCDERSLLLSEERYKLLVREVEHAQNASKNQEPLTSKDYRRLKRFDIMKMNETEKIIQKRIHDSEPIIYYCRYDELYDALKKAHIDVGHKRTRVMETELKKKYCNITREVIDLFLSTCEQCQLKKKMPKKGLVVRPILSNYMNCRCQVDLIDMQSEPDGPFRFILNYQDHLTKFTLLRALKTKTAEEVAYNLVDIFCMFGAPFILQSDNGREFSNKIIKNLTELWPGMKLVHGKPRHSQSQGSVERSNQDVRDMLVSWMADNKTKNWSEGLRFIQSKKNRALHVGIKMSPYEAMFGSPQIVGLADSPLTEDVYSNIETEEELEELLNNINNNNELQSLDNVGDCDLIDKNKENDKDSSKVYCIICEQESSGAHKCSECDNFVHAICGKSKSEGFGKTIVCNICDRKKSIRTEQNNAKKNLKKQAEKMLALSNSKFPPAEIGTSVVVRVPDVDRGRLAPRNVLAVVTQVESSGLYKLGTKNGTLERLYARNEFTIADGNFVNENEVPADKISLRSASTQSSGSKQGFVFCQCKRMCIDKKCKCRNSNVLCNSKCHSNSSCKNK